MPFTIRCPAITPKAQPCQQWQGGGGNPVPKQTAAAKRTEKKNEQLLDYQLEQSKKPAVMPVIPVPEPAKPLAPPPSSSSADVLNAEQDAKRKAAARRGYRDTLLASTKNPNALGGAQSLLG
jgi:hypothetical protein